MLECRVLELLDTQHFESVKNDLVPFLVRKQHRSRRDGIPDKAGEIQCYTLVPGDGFGVRMDSMTNFMELNKLVAAARSSG